MMMSEFVERTGFEPSYEEYRIIEDSYYEFDGNKDEFCKWFKKAQKSGEWAKELKLRKRIAELEQEQKKDTAELNEELDFYRPYYGRARVAEGILKATGKTTVKEFNLKVKDKLVWNHHENVTVRYIDNGTFQFINVVEQSGWTTSYRVNEIEMVDVRCEG